MNGKKIIKNLDGAELSEFLNKQNTEAEVLTRAEAKQKKQISKQEAAVDINYEYDLSFLSDKLSPQQIDDLIQNQILKPKRSQFEPDPVFFKLPSGSSVIDKKFLSADNEILVRRMASPEEEILIDAFEKLQVKDFNNAETLKEIEYKLEEAFTEILNNVIKTNINAEDLSSIDKLPLMIFLLAFSYAKEINLDPSEVLCDRCQKISADKNANKHSVVVDLLNDLEINYITNDFQYPFTETLLSYPGADINFTFKFPSIKDQGELLKSNKDNKLFMRLITLNISGTQKNGKEITKKDWDDIRDYLNKEDKDKIRKKLKTYTEFGWTGKCNFKCTDAMCPIKKDNKKLEVLFPTILQKMIDRISSNDEEDIE